MEDIRKKNWKEKINSNNLNNFFAKIGEVINHEITGHDIGNSTNINLLKDYSNQKV